MKQQISLQQYRSIDLTILAIVMAVIQAVVCFASSRWFADQLYVASPVAIVVALVMMRWGAWAAIHALLGALVFTMVSGGSVQHYLIYGVGNLFSMIALVMFHILGKEKIRNNVVFTLLFGFVVQALMLVGRAVTALAVGYPPTACLGFITTDALSVLFTLCGVWVIRRMDGLFEDQIQYLLRIQKEQSVEGREQL